MVRLAKIAGLRGEIDGPQDFVRQMKIHASPSSVECIMGENIYHWDEFQCLERQPRCPPHLLVFLQTDFQSKTRYVLLLAEAGDHFT